METTRNTIIALIATIGILFAVVTYARESIALGVTGIVCMLLLYWVGKEYVA